MSADRPDRFVLDSGVAIAWFFPETEKERLYAASVLRLIAEGARVYRAFLRSESSHSIEG